MGLSMEHNVALYRASDMLYGSVGDIYRVTADLSSATRVTVRLESATGLFRAGKAGL